MKFFWPYLSNKNQKIRYRDDKCHLPGDETPFHFVVFHGLSDVADFMIEELQSIEDCFTKNDMDTSLNNKFKEYWTPVHIMFQGGHAEIIRSLGRKVDFEFINPALFKEILHVAIECGYLDCIKALIEKKTSSFQRNAVDIAKNYYSITMNQNHYKIILQYLSEEFKSSDVPTLQKY